MTKAVLAEYLHIHLIIPRLAVINKTLDDLLADPMTAVIGANADTAHNCGGKSVRCHSAKSDECVSVISIDRIEAVFCSFFDLFVRIARKVIPV